MKRLLSLNQPVNYETKKSRTITREENDTSVTCIEDLVNELFYEIFDYLDACEIFDAFSNLNTRFDQFLGSSSFLLKIYRYSTRERTFKRYNKQVIIPNKHKVISLCLYDQTLINSFCTQCNIDLSFNRLESLVLIGIKLNQLLPVLVDVKNLPRLFSLNILLIGDYKDLDQLYELIFRLPFLKYLKITLAIDKRLALLSIATSPTISTIEQLNINHVCTLHELNIILSYTPQLRRLTCQRLMNSENTFSCRLPNMTHISLNECDLDFDEFENFIRQICCKLQVLRMISQSNDISYMDADRWERLISQNIPHLHKFNFQSNRYCSFSNAFTTYHTRINQFTSSFWTEHRWIFEIISLGLDYMNMKYSIRPYRKEWFDFHQTEQLTESSEQKSIYHNVSLTVTSASCDPHRPSSMTISNSIFSLVKIIHVNVDCTRAHIVPVIELIRRLPYVNSIRILPMTVQTIHSLSSEQIENLILDSRNCKLTRMKLTLTTDIEQVLFFIRLNRFIEYLEIECSNDIHPELLVQYVLLKTDECATSRLCSLCLCIEQTTDELIEKLHQIMTLKRPRCDHTIKPVYDKIYLQWK